MPLFPNASYQYTQINRQTVFQETAMASYARVETLECHNTVTVDLSQFISVLLNI